MNKKLLLVLLVIGFTIFSYLWTNLAGKHTVLLRKDSEGLISVRQQICSYRVTNQRIDQSSNEFYSRLSECSRNNSWIKTLSASEKIFTFTYGLPGLLYITLDDLVIESGVGFVLIDSIVGLYIYKFFMPIFIVSLIIFVLAMPFLIFKFSRRIFQASV